MANSGRKDSISSQFFLVLADGTADAGSEKLKKLGGRQYVTFGKVMLAGEMGEEGQRVLQRLDEVATEDGKPTECVWVERCGVE